MPVEAIREHDGHEISLLAKETTVEIGLMSTHEDHLRGQDTISAHGGLCTVRSAAQHLKDIVEAVKISYLELKIIGPI